MEEKRREHVERREEGCRMEGEFSGVTCYQDTNPIRAPALSSPLGLIPSIKASAPNTVALAPGVSAFGGSGQ